MMSKHPRQTLNNRGFSLSEGLLALVIVGVIGVVGIYVYQHSSIKNVGSIIGKSTTLKACKTTSDILFCAETPKSIISATDRLHIEATLKNQTNSTYTTAAIYSSSCSQPSIVLNGKELLDIRTCTADITAASIEAGKTVTYDLPIDVTKLKPGNNTIVLKWNQGKLMSGTLNVKLKSTSNSDKAELKKCFTAQTVLPYCGFVVITIKQDYYKQGIQDGESPAVAGSTCEDLGEYIKPLGLVPFRDDCHFADMGIITVSVPKQEADSWANKIKALPQVDSAAYDENWTNNN